MTRRVLTLCLLAIACGLRAQDGDLAERLFLSGERAYQARAHAEALDTWRQVVQQAPASDFAAQALLRMATHWAITERKPEVAMPFLDTLKAEHMDSSVAAEALLLRGILLAGKARKPADLKEAIGEFNRLTDLFPTRRAATEAHFHLGRAYRQQGQCLRALQHFLETRRQDPEAPVALQAMLQAAEVMDLTGDLPGCLRMLQDVRNLAPQSPEAQEAHWRIGLRVRHRLQKPPLRSEGPWPKGRQKWLKSPTHLAVAEEGLLIYQDGLDRVTRLAGDSLEPIGPEAKGLKALVPAPGHPWFLFAKTGVLKGEGPAVAVPGTPSCAALDPWGTLWIGDAKLGQITLLSEDGSSRTLPSPSSVAMASLPSGGVALASDANRAILFLDASGKPRATVPYGQGLPAPFRYVLALASDPTGNVAAITDGGDFEGIVLWGPDGSLLRRASFKDLGLGGKYRGIALARDGGILLADRSNDLLVRLY